MDRLTKEVVYHGRKFYIDIDLCEGRSGMHVYDLSLTVKDDKENLLYQYLGGANTFEDFENTVRSALDSYHDTVKSSQIFSDIKKWNGVID